MARGHSKKEERMKEVYENKYGEKFKIIDYSNANKITVKFFNGFIKKCTFQNIENKQVSSPFDKEFFGVGYLGIGGYCYKKDKKAYCKWYEMLRRCYDKKYQEKKPTYKGCAVCEEWHNFQNFAKWFYENYYEIEGEIMHLDKDILVKGNKIYSPQTCCIVPQKINSLFIKRIKNDDLPIGVYKHNDENRTFPYCASCNNPNGKRTRVYFSDAHKAFLWYKINKELIIQMIADEYKDFIPAYIYNAMCNYRIEATD